MITTFNQKKGDEKKEDTKYVHGKTEIGETSMGR